MELHKAQKEIAKSNARFRVANCGRRFGKTILASEEIKAVAISRDDARVVYIAPTYQAARDILWADLIKSLDEIIIKANESRLELKVHNLKGGESIIQLRGWESVETLRGQKFDFMVIDEVAMMKNFWVNWYEVLIPTLTDRKAPVLFLSTPKGFNHFYDLYGTTGEDWASFNFTSYDNPHLDNEEIDKLKATMSHEAFEQEFMASFVKSEGLVYKEFSRDRHTFDTPPEEFKETLGAVDFGFTNPTAVLTVKVDRQDHYWVTEELYKTGLTHEVIGDYVANKNYEKVYPDPASPEAIEVLRQKGVNVYEVVKGQDSIQTGIQKVRDLFKQGRLHIHKDCKNLIQELEMYHYPDKKPDKNEDEVPIKENDHALDALRYLIMTHSPETRNLIQERMRYNMKRRNPSTNFIR